MDEVWHVTRTCDRCRCRIVVDCKKRRRYRGPNDYLRALGWASRWLELCGLRFEVWLCPACSEEVGDANYPP